MQESENKNTQPDADLSVTDGVEQETKTPENTRIKHDVPRNPDGTIQKGFSLNPAGKPKGVKHFNTYFREAVKQIAKSRGTSAEDVMTDLAKSGILQALNPKGKSSFLYFQEIFDRLDGKPAQTIINEYDDEVESVEVKIIKTKDEARNAINSRDGADATV